ncbi:sortase B [Evansella caseinilytica]|uniref:Sortase B n=1 Tax=Evansella caseinilytica TaxID=1503961 RepID=A0A1H3SBY6_9BACI|nr:class B sortase [Evansella caseinilytica]SDZ35434.1 sortase B [Evansella caseinilytica]
MKMKKLLAAAWILLIGYSVYTIADYWLESSSNKKAYEEIRSQFNKASANAGEEASVSTDQENGQPADEKVITERFQFLLDEVNQDIVGWVQIPGTAIDYPVVQTDNNDDYLDYNIYKRPAKAGAIFMDFRNSGEAEDLHTILYGHNMKDGSMFKELLHYKEEDFFDEFRTIQFHTLYEETEWEIFSVYVTDTDFYYIETDFPTTDDYLLFLDNIIGRSLYQSDITFSSNDQLLTLTTCDYDLEDGRFVVHAKKRK